MTLNPNEPFTRKRAALYLGKSVQTLANWKTKGRGPKITYMGGEHDLPCYLRKDLEAFVQGPDIVPKRTRGRQVGSMNRREFQ